jgi:hypothetical protein
VSPTRLFGGRPTTRDERTLALRIASIFAIPMAFIMVIPLIVGFLIYRHEVQARLHEDRHLVEQFREERIERSRAINEFVYEQCLQSEVRDVVIAEQLRAALQRVKATLPAGSLVRQTQEQILRDGIAALEPPNEPDCTPPPAVKPEGPP